MRRLLVLLAILLFSLPACVVRSGGRNGDRGGGGSSSSDDDDVVSDDDDDDDGADDDDTTSSGDDDDTGDFDCFDEFFHNENSEPNDDQESAEEVLVSPNDYGWFEITGTVSECGSGDGYGDTDWFAVYITCPRTTDLSLDWDGGSDLDVFLVDAGGTELISGIEEGSVGEQGTVTVTEPGLYWVAVGCWDGSSTSYEARLRFD